MFKFGFSSDGNEEKCHKSSEKANEPVRPCREILGNFDEKLIEDFDTCRIQTKNHEIKYISSVEVVLELIKKCQEDEECTILNAEQNHSDLLKGIYEGGLKIWECTHDVLNYLEDKNVDLSGKSVLDLGCGTGVLGIFTLLQGSSCTFQDYNDEVIENVTIPNVKLNVDSMEKTRFFSGDWSEFYHVLSGEKLKFDVIITSETIYNPENYPKLIEIFNLLKDDGVIYLAAKGYYFGVGGCLTEFLDQLDNSQKFKHETVWKTDSGLARKIVEIKLK